MKLQHLKLGMLFLLVFVAGVLFGHFDFGNGRVLLYATPADHAPTFLNKGNAFEWFYLGNIAAAIAVILFACYLIAKSMRKQDKEKNRFSTNPHNPSP